MAITKFEEMIEDRVPLFCFIFAQVLIYIYLFVIDHLLSCLCCKKIRNAVKTLNTGYNKNNKWKILFFYRTGGGGVKNQTS